MNTMRKKDFSLSVKDVSGEGTFEGYASTFGGAPDSYGDVIAPGAFADSLAKHRREGTMPMMFFGHDMGELPIGDWLEMAEDGKGLWGKGQLDLEDPVSERIYRALKKKRVRGLSIGYSIPAGGSRPAEKRPGVTVLEKINLVEVSIVNNPANKRSLVDEVKAEARELRDRVAAGERLTEREWERLLKAQFDLSNSEAERAVRINLKTGQGAPGSTADDVTAFMQALLRR